MTECAAGRRAFFGGQWVEPCPEEGHHVIVAPSEDSISLCDEHFQEVAQAGLVNPVATGIGIAEGQIHIATPTGNAFHREIVTDDVFVVRDPTMAVPELMRCQRCHEFIVEGSRCTFIGEHYRHLVHASCVGL